MEQIGGNNNCPKPNITFSYMQMRYAKILQWNILKRIQNLPAEQIGLVRRMVMHTCGCTQSKYYRVMQERDNDVHVLIALAKVLRCKVDDVLNPAFEFKDPQLNAKQVARITAVETHKRKPEGGSRQAKNGKPTGQKQKKQADGLLTGEEDGVRTHDPQNHNLVL